ncbi:hypothetical protein [Haloarcula salinisoli]|nr:hypothetical protein [Halomicroarcula salinisoli]
MSKRETDYSDRMKRGSDKWRTFFSFFGIRSARADREHTADE